MNTKQRKRAAKIGISALLLAIIIVLRHTCAADITGTHSAAAFAVYLVPYLLAGHDVILKAIKNIMRGNIFDEQFLMSIATFGALGVKEYAEACAVMIFYQAGELFQDMATERSRKSIADLMDICPEYACIEENGAIKQVSPDEVPAGTIIIARPGERIPLDGIITEGNSLLDTSALTGESMPRSVHPGDTVFSGCINGKGMIKIKTSGTFENSTVSRILELTENASEKKAKTENFITSFARYYTPAVTTGAMLLALIPPLMFGGAWTDWILRACIFLVVSCPCALVLSVPLGFFAGIGAASRKGILVKGGNFLEAAAEIKYFAIDKTGTLTMGEFEVADVLPAETDRNKLIEIAALAESASNHPIAISIKKFFSAQEKKEMPDISRISSAEEIAGHGIRAKIDGKNVLAGSLKMMSDNGIICEKTDSAATAVNIAVNGKYAGAILISDKIKPETAKAIEELKSLGIKNITMLTGDRNKTAEAVSSGIGIGRYIAELLPQDKVKAIEKLMSERKDNGKLAYAGDGINDAPVLARADIGFAMGSLGSAAAIEAADIVIMDDDLLKIPQAIKTAKKTMRIVKENIVFSIGVKMLVLILGAAGAADMWQAVFADVGVCVIAILNSMRMLRFSGKN